MNSRFDLLPTPIADLHILQRKPMRDRRGYLERMFCVDELQAIFPRPVIQINRTLTARRGTIRGLHFQYAPHAERKLVSCLRGEVFDVAVDLRRSSPTFLRWHAEILSDDNHRSLVIPEGCAHGIQTLTDGCEMLYLHTAAFWPEAAGTLNPCDPHLAIPWPLETTELSDSDRAGALIDTDFRGLDL